MEEYYYKGEYTYVINCLHCKVKHNEFFVGVTKSYIVIRCSNCGYTVDLIECRKYFKTLMGHNIKR